MKYLIINGSPRRENTWKIVKRAKDNLDKFDNNTYEEIDLINLNIPPCIGCYNCFNNGENTCPHSNIIEPIVEKMKTCDGLIITSPVYVLNVTGLIKNFFDHLAYFYHRPYFFDKRALIVVTTAGNGHKKVASYMDENLRNMGYNQRFILSFIHAHDIHGYLPLKTKEKIDKVTTMFYKSIKENIIKSPSMKSLFMYNIWRAMASSNTIKKDNEYWTENNMLNDEFYPTIPCNILKKLPFKIFYKIMLNFLSKNRVYNKNRKNFH